MRSTKTSGASHDKQFGLDKQQIPRIRQIRFSADVGAFQLLQTLASPKLVLFLSRWRPSQCKKRPNVGGFGGAGSAPDAKLRHPRDKGRRKPKSG